ncbi:MAG: hypothetical protein KL787_08940 [Taibaiella sp.]|nr:hypothetical protein [Taibaiella sp.]
MEKNNRVIVLSIPDWGVTPFALEKEMDPDQVGQEIDTFNNINKSISIRKECALYRYHLFYAVPWHSG